MIKVLLLLKSVFIFHYLRFEDFAVPTQMVACLPLVQKVRGSLPGGVVNFHLKIFNLGASKGGDVHFIIARLYVLYITVLE